MWLNIKIFNHRLTFHVKEAADGPRFWLEVMTNHHSHYGHLQHFCKALSDCLWQVFAEVSAGFYAIYFSAISPVCCDQKPVSQRSNRPLGHKVLMAPRQHTNNFPFSGRHTCHCLMRTGPESWLQKTYRDVLITGYIHLSHLITELCILIQWKQAHKAMWLLGTEPKISIKGFYLYIHMAHIHVR